MHALGCRLMVVDTIQPSQACVYLAHLNSMWCKLCVCVCVLLSLGGMLDNCRHLKKQGKLAQSSWRLALQS